jgi:cytosine/creatinine deaminase
MSRIETDKTILPYLSLSTEERAGNLIRECVACGTSHLRTHVDVDLESGLGKLEGVLAARERYRDRATVQIVAFPQSGVMRCPGVLDLLDAAVRNGADLVGGIDPLEIDRDPKGQLDGIFAIAARHGVGLDIHLHEPGEMGLFNVQEICARTKAVGLVGKVTISHGFCLGGVTERKAAEAAETMAEAGVGRDAARRRARGRGRSIISMSREWLQRVDCGHSRKALESVVNHPVRRGCTNGCLGTWSRSGTVWTSGKPLKRLLSMHRVLNASKAAAAN